MEREPSPLLAAYLIRNTGAFLASWVNPNLRTFDENLLTENLPVVLDYVQRSPTTLGHTTETFSSGGLTILVERGRHSELVAVVRGQPPWPLRHALRDAVRSWEARSVRLRKTADLGEEAAATMDEVLPRVVALAGVPRASF